MTIEITTSAAIARYHHLSSRMNDATTEQLAGIIADRHRLLVAIAAKANIPPKKGWRQQTLAWMDGQLEVVGVGKEA
jgi:hypothetical protein